jgi:hypothetical protein
MSEPWSWFCKLCLESHVTDACPLNPEFRSPFLYEHNPVETIYLQDNKNLADCAMKFDQLQRIDISSMKQPSVEQLLQKLIGIQIDLTNALTTMADSFNALAESNQALVQAMIESGEIENGPQDQTL